MCRHRPMWGRDLPRKINPTRLGFAASSQEITWVPGDGGGRQLSPFFREQTGAGPEQRRRCRIWICRRATQFAGPRVAKPRWSEACVAARSVSKKHANATSFQSKSSWLGRRRSKPTVSGRCTSPGFSTTAPLPNVESQPNEVVISFGDREFSRGRSSGGGPELALDTPRGIETLAVVTHDEARHRAADAAGVPVYPYTFISNAPGAGMIAAVVS
jgi:hypothetical protein